MSRYNHCFVTVTVMFHLVKVTNPRLVTMAVFTWKKLRRLDVKTSVSDLLAVNGDELTVDLSLLFSLSCTYGQNIPVRQTVIPG